MIFWKTTLLCDGVDENRYSKLAYNLRPWLRLLEQILHTAAKRSRDVRQGVQRAPADHLAPGAHVNKVSTRVTLLFDLDGSPSLSDIQKARLHAALSGRIGKDGVLRVVAQSTRSQLTNKKLAVERFVALLREALTPRPPRRKTRATLASKRRRLEAKRRRGTVKQQRSRLTEGED